MTQNTEQNVRTRVATWAVVAPTGKVISTHDDEAEAVKAKQSHWAAVRHCRLTEAEARGAAEQRRKDVEGQQVAGYIPANTPNFFSVSEAKYASTALHRNPFPNDVPVYYRPANVAALEARIAELEGENTTLKKRVINAAETLLSIETPCMEGDNFAVTICSYFEDCEGEPCDNGWHEGATKAYEEIKDAVLQHFRAALTREGGV